MSLSGHNQYHQSSSSLPRFMGFESTLELSISLSTIPKSFFFISVFEQGKVGRSEGQSTGFIESDRSEFT